MTNMELSSDVGRRDDHDVAMEGDGGLMTGLWREESLLLSSFIPIGLNLIGVIMRREIPNDITLESNSILQSFGFKIRTWLRGWHLRDQGVQEKLFHL